MKKHLLKFLLPIGFMLTAVGVNAQISTFPWNDDLESENNCSGSCNATCNMSGAGFTNDPASNAEWTIDAGGTSSNPTGPQGVDHNPGTFAGKYAYVESSFPCSSGNPTALLNSPFFDFTNISVPGVSFWYHMFGQSMGTMHIDVEIAGVWTLDIIPAWTDNVDLWQEQVVSMPMLGGLNNVRFRIRGVVGNGFWSDMAVDDFSVFDAVYQVLPLELVDPLCYGDTTGSISVDGLFGVPPFTFAWDNGSTSSIVTDLASGTHCVTITDANLDTVSNCFVLNDPDSVASSQTIITPLVCKYDVSEVSVTGSGGVALTEPYFMDTNSANYSWDSSGVCTTVPLPGNVTGALDIGFDFEFYGNTYDEFQIARNGFIGFGGGLDDGCCSGEPVPHNSAFEPDNAIFAAWFDVDGGDLSYCLSGQAPNRKLIVNFVGLGDNTIDDNFTGQIILHETSNCIEIQTEYMQYDGFYNQFDDCTQGITNDGSSLGMAYPGRNADEGGASGGWEADSSYVSFCPVDSTGLAYIWSTGHVGNTIYGLQPGTYTMSATDLNGCFSEETVVIDPAVSNLTLNPAISDISCFGFNDGMIETNQSGGISPISYTWNSGQTSADITNQGQGTYVVVSEDAVGCLDSVSGMVIAEPDLLVSSVYSLESTQCPEDANGSIGIVVSGGVSPYNILWSDGQVGPIASNLPAGTYTAQITDSSGCLSVQSAAILAEFNSPSVDLGANIKQTTGAAATLNAGIHAGYLWSTGATSQTIQVSATGIYGVEVYNSNGCAASDSVYVEIWPTGINDISEDAKFALYPNPTSSNLLLNLEGMESVSDVTVRVVNVQGQIVMERVVNTISSSETIELDVNALAPGMYNLSLESDAFNAVKSFVKQ